MILSASCSPLLRSVAHTVAAGLLALCLAGLLACQGGDPARGAWDPAASREEKLERVIELGALGSAEGVKVLEQASRDPLEEIRIEAIRSLGKSGRPEALPILERFAGSDLSSVRATTAWALGRMKGNKDALRLLEKLLDDDELGVRQRTVSAIAAMDDHDATPALVKAAVREPDPGLRDNIIQILSYWGDRRAVPLLEEALGSETDEIRGHAAAALANMGDLSCAPALQGALEDFDPVVRGSAALSLARLGDVDSLALVRKKAESEGDPLAQATMCWSIGLLTGEEGPERGWAVEQLETILLTRTNADFARAQAAKALGDLNSCRSREVLKRARNDRKGIVVNAASNALKELDC
jgi:HEAT repeat protein